MRFLDPARHVKPTCHPFHSPIAPLPDPLHVACAISNPERYITRYKHYQNFAKHMADSGVPLYTCEVAYGDRYHEVTDAGNPRHLQLRTSSELWHKENILNLCVARFPDDWKYGAYVDADFLMTRPDWAEEAVHQLQHFDWLQLFASYSNLGPRHAPISGYRPGFVKAFREQPIPVPYPASYFASMGFGAPGGAWAFRREAFEAVGGLLDTCILGSADHHMAIGLLSVPGGHHDDVDNGSPAYTSSIRLWQDRAAAAAFHVGYLDNYMVHYFHGRHANRGYHTRPAILKKHQFDPNRDVVRDANGLLRWAGNKRALEADVRDYFRARNEDQNTL